MLNMGTVLYEPTASVMVLRLKTEVLNYYSAGLQPHPMERTVPLLYGLFWGGKHQHKPEVKISENKIRSTTEKTFHIGI